MGGFKDLAELVDGGPHLDLPIRGKVYRIEDPDAETALWLSGLLSLYERAEAGEDIDPSKLDLDDDAELQLYHRAIGREVYEQMLADGVRTSEMKVVIATVVTWIKVDEATAIEVWESAARGEGPRPTGNRHSRRASEAMARTTQKRGSGTTTKASRKGGKGRPRPGTTSSPSGRS